MLSPLIRRLGTLLNSGGPFPGLGIMMQRGRSLFSVSMGPVETQRGCAVLLLFMRSTLSIIAGQWQMTSTSATLIYTRWGCAIMRLTKVLRQVEECLRTMKDMREMNLRVGPH